MDAWKRGNVTVAESTQSRAALSAPEGGEVSWTFSIDNHRSVWDWSVGSPDPRSLKPVRRPTSGAASRHIPVRAFSMRTSDYLELESGLEHDLVRMLDRENNVDWLVAQPFQLDWGIRAHRRLRHTPDLLSVDSAGGVTVWDVKRPEAASSEAFAHDRETTAAACATVGWNYRVFSGLLPTHRHNLMWLHSYRRRPGWAAAYEPDLMTRTAAGCALGELLTRYEPEQAAVVWHLIWAGLLHVDLTSRLTDATRVTS